MPGGGERYVQSLALELARHGHEITAVTTTATLEKHFWQGQPAWQGEDLPISVIRCPVRPMPGGRLGLLAWRKAMVLVSLAGGNTAVLRRMARFIPPIHSMEMALTQLPTPFDVVHGFNISWEQAMLAGWQFAWQQGTPFVATPFAHLGHGKKDRVALNSTMRHQLEMLRQADRVLTLTSVEREGLISYGLLPERVAVIGGGVDAPSVGWATAVPPAIPSPYALFVGRLSYDKGAIHAAQAVLALRQQGQVITLGLVGQNTPEFEKFYGRLSPTEQEGIRPFILLPEPQKHALLAQTTMLLLPSNTDSFGIVLLEAWTHGKPVIGARAGGIPGVIDDGQNGLLVPFGDVPALSKSIGILLADGSLQQRLGENGRNKTHAVYTWQNVAEKVVNEYRLILDSRY